MKRTLTLTPRLQKIADLVPPGARFADIGTDHAYLPVWLLRQGRLEHAIASDINNGPLERARLTAEEYGCTRQMSFRLGAGLDQVQPGEADTVAIAGMGGETIAEILSAAAWLKEQPSLLLLQPMSAQENLRRYLWHNGYLIQQEYLVGEGRKIYLILQAVPGEVALPGRDAEYWLGRPDTWAPSPLWDAYLSGEEARLRRAVEGLARAVRPEDRLRRDMYQQVLLGLNELREEWHSHDDCR